MWKISFNILLSFRFWSYKCWFYCRFTRIICGSIIFNSTKIVSIGILLRRIVRCPFFIEFLHTVISLRHRVCCKIVITNWPCRLLEFCNLSTLLIIDHHWIISTIRIISYITVINFVITSIRIKISSYKWTEHKSLFAISIIFPFIFLSCSMVFLIFIKFLLLRSISII